MNSDSEVMPGYAMKWDSAWGWTIACKDMDKAPCPQCIGAGTITDDDGYDHDGNLTPEYELTCPRCLGKGTFRLEMETDGTENS